MFNVLQLTNMHLCQTNMQRTSRNEPRRTTKVCMQESLEINMNSAYFVEDKNISSIMSSIYSIEQEKQEKKQSGVYSVLPCESFVTTENKNLAFQYSPNG